MGFNSGFKELIETHSQKLKRNQHFKFVCIVKTIMLKWIKMWIRSFRLNLSVSEYG